MQLAVRLTRVHLPVLIGMASLTALLPAGALRADPAAAMIDGEPVRLVDVLAGAQASLDAQAADVERARRQLAFRSALARERIVVDELDHRIDAQILSREAKARQTSVEALVLAQRPKPVSDTDARAFYAQMQAQIQQPYEVVEGRIKKLLEEDAAKQAHDDLIRMLRAKYHVAVLREPLRVPVAATGPVRGAATAAVTIVEFSDFECPYCRRMEPVLQQLLASHPADVRLVYRHFPLQSVHPHATDAARAAVCAERQSRFWEMHDGLFAQTAALDPPAVKAVATAAGIDPAAYDDCLVAGQANDSVNADVASAEAIGLSGTPALFVNGRFLDGAVPYRELEALVADELARARRGGAHAAGR